MVQNLTITGYTLSCPNGTAITTSATTSTVNISTIPFTNYTCTLTAQTNLGIIPLSTCMFLTPQDSKYSFEKCSCIHVLNLFSVPGGPPQNIQFISSMTSVILQWQPPAQPNGIITAYKITAMNTQQTVIVNSSITSYTFCGLQPGQLVSYTISASTEAGEGPTVNITATTQEKGEFTTNN